MNILAYVPDFPPLRYTGAELMLIDYLHALQKKGHEVTVVMSREKRVVPEYEGIPIKVVPRWLDFDTIITHGGSMGEAFNQGIELNKTVIYLCHNTYRHAIRPEVKVVFNSQFTKDNTNINGNENVVCQPIINFDYKRKKRKGKYITLINCSELKGGKLFYEIAKENNRLKFLAVKGWYGKQGELEAKNIKQIKPVKHEKIYNVFKKTRILLVPSSYECWGRIGVEAMASGIPVICSKGVGGLKEAYGNGAKYVNRENINEWAKAIKEIDGDYDKWVERGFMRIKALKKNINKSILNFETLCKGLN